MNGPPELIKAPPGPYKIKPPNPGGLDISGESETAFETSAGEDKDSQLDLNKLPEAPVAKPAKDAAEDRSAPNETKTPVARRRQAEPQPTGATGSVVQLGAFANQAQAERAWTALSAPLPERRGDEQDDRALLGRHPAARRRGVSGRRQAGVPDAEGRRRKLLRRAIG